MESKYEQESTNALLAALYPTDAVDTVDAVDAVETVEAPTLAPELAAELDSLRSLRSLFGSLPDAEPPSALNAKLLAAAGKAVKNVKTVATPPRPSVLDHVLGWFEPLRAHPGLAALASLVLVASIGGVLLLNKKTNKDQATPAAISAEGDSASLSNGPSSAAPLESQKESASIVADDERGIDGDGAAPNFELDSQDEIQNKDRPLDLKKNDKSKTVRGSATKQAPRKPTNNRANDRASVTGKGATTIDLPVLDAIGSEGSVGTRGGDESKGPSRGAGTSPSSPSSPSKVGTDTASPTPDADPEPTQPTTKPQDPQEPPEPTSSKTLTKKQLAELKSLRTKARGYAKNSDCTSVKKLGKRVQAIDDGYFDATFLADDTIGSCYRVRK